MVWDNESSSRKRISSEILSPTKSTIVRNSKSFLRAYFETSEFASILLVLSEPILPVSRKKVIIYI